MLIKDLFTSHLELGAYLVSFALIAGYHLYLRLRLRRDKSYTIQSVNNAARSAWVENVMAENNGILAVQTLRSGIVPPTINLDEPDAENDLDYVPHTARDVKINVALTNSFGFGGTNACILLKRYET